MVGFWIGWFPQAGKYRRQTCSSRLFRLPGSRCARPLTMYRLPPHCCHSGYSSFVLDLSRITAHDQDRLAQLAISPRWSDNQRTAQIGHHRPQVGCREADPRRYRQVGEFARKPPACRRVFASHIHTSVSIVSADNRLQIGGRQNFRTFPRYLLQQTDCRPDRAASDPAPAHPVCNTHRVCAAFRFRLLVHTRNHCNVFPNYLQKRRTIRYQPPKEFISIFLPHRRML